MSLDPDVRTNMVSTISTQISDPDTTLLLALLRQAIKNALIVIDDDHLYALYNLLNPPPPGP